jgi:hypothetical protein
MSEFEEVTTECGIQVDRRHAVHFPNRPEGDGWEPVKWLGELRPNGDPRFSVVWRRPKEIAQRKPRPSSGEMVRSISIYFDGDYDENVRRALADIEQHPDY